LWPYIINKNLEIFFAHQTFNWSNNAKGNAGVSCVIIGLRNIENKQKILFNKDNVIKVNNINPYLTDGKNIIVTPRTNTISNFPEIHTGSSPIDGGNLILENNEAQELFQKYENASDFIKPYIGGNDFLTGIKRFCLWIDDNQLNEALKIDEIRNRIDRCKIWRNKSGRDAKKYADSPHRFVYRKYQIGDCLILPMTTSERREYFPVGYQKSGTVVSNGVFTIYNPKIYIFAALSSKMHMLWLKTIGGRMREDLRYSGQLVYNTFPFNISDIKITDKLENLALELIDAREKYTDKTISELYDPNKMPKSILQCHLNIDDVFESTYKTNGFKSDEEKIEYLFNLYVKSLGDIILL